MAKRATYRGPGGARGARATPADERVQRDPLQHIAEEHLRQREVCAALDALAGADRPDRAAARDCLEHLTVFLPRHTRDEEEDLFPLLRRRSAPEDEINETLDRLYHDHTESHDALPRVIAALERMIAENAPFTEDEAAAVSAFAQHERRHLIVENAIVLPLARVRLTKDDLGFLSLRMQLRRNGRAKEDH